jgi:hypothetical protein
LIFISESTCTPIRSLCTCFGGTMLLPHGDATASSIFRENIHFVAAV